MKKGVPKKKVKIFGNGKKAHETLKSFHILANATTVFYQSLKTAGEKIHGRGELSDPKRGVLMQLYRYGPQTVPKMGRARKVTRQHIQTIVNTLLDAGHIELIDNPDHKRSSLVRLTRQGELQVEKMSQLEADVLSRIDLEVKDKEMLDAAEVLTSINKTFESRKWRELLEEFNLLFKEEKK